MVLGLGASAFAATGDIVGAAFSDVAGHEAENELSVLGALGIFSGEQGLGGPVKPDDPLTRAQFCKVVVVATGRGNMAQSLGGLRPDFADEVPQWAWGYVNTAVYMGVINGYEDGTFRGDNPVTYAEAVTMLVRAVPGHVAQVGEGVWPYNYIFYGVDNGFAGEVDVSFAGLPCSRGDMARLLFATMQVAKLDAEGKPVADSALLAGRLFTGIFKGYSSGTNQATVATASGNQALTCADPTYVVGAEGYAALLGLDVMAVLDRAGSGGKCVFVGTAEAANTFAGVFAEYVDTADADSTVDSYKFEDGTVVPFTTATLVAVNGATAATDGPGDGELLVAGDECVVVLGDDGKASNLTVLRFDLGTIYVEDLVKSTSESDTVVEFSFDTGEGTLYFDIPIAESVPVTLNATAIDRDELRTWDVIQLASRDGTGFANFFAEHPDYNINPVFAVRATRQMVEGEVEAVRTVYPGEDVFVEIAGTEYQVNADGFVSGTPSIGSTARYALNDAGELFVDIYYDEQTNWVVLKNYTTGTAGSFLTVDLRGEEVTYACDPDLFTEASLSDLLGAIVALDFDPNSNLVVDYYRFDWDCYTAFDIVSVDPETGMVTVRVIYDNEDPYYLVFDRPVAYQYENGVATYVPFESIGLWATTPTTDVDFLSTDDGYAAVLRYYVETARTITVDGPALSAVMTATEPTQWYAFEAVEGETYVITTSNLAGDADTALSLFGADGSQILFNDDSSGWASQLTWTADRSGTVYFEVGPYDAWSYGSYDVTVVTEEILY